MKTRPQTTDLRPKDKNTTKEYTSNLVLFPIFLSEVCGLLSDLQHCDGVNVDNYFHSPHLVPVLQFLQ